MIKLTRMTLSKTKFLPLLLCSFISVTAVSAYAGDPTRPPGLGSFESKKEPVKRTSFKLQQIKISAGSRSAVINGQIVREGDSVSGAEVLKITSDKVVLKYRKKLRFLSLINRTKHSEK